MTLDDLEPENNLFSSVIASVSCKQYTHRCRALTFVTARLSC